MSTYNQATSALRKQSETFASSIGIGCKQIGLLRALAVITHPSYDDDYPIASADATTTTIEGLQAGGMNKEGAKNLTRNACKVESLAILVHTIGLSQEIFTAIPTNDAKKAFKVIDEENVEEANALTLTKSGNLTKASKAWLGLIPSEADKDGDKDGDGDGDGDNDPKVDPAELLKKAITQITNAENAINKLEGHNVEKQDALIALSKMIDRVQL
jgi:hypothetical protein